MFTISIGVCVFNEEKNIKSLLNSLCTQKTTKDILEIIVISSACSDNTDKIIENDFAKSFPAIVLLKQKKREGKASAINLFLEKAKGDILVLESGDTIPAEDMIEKLTESFRYPKIGMVGGRPIPVNDPDTFIGFTVHLLWELHHKLAMRHPKLGEVVAFRRNLIKKIPTDTSVDEAFIEALIREQGYELMYVPTAIVYNKGPETISDYLKQRRRIFTGHIHLRKVKGYEPSSMKKFLIMKLLFETARQNTRKILWICGGMLLESYGRTLGLYDFHIRKHNPYIWNVAITTKENITEIAKNITEVPEVTGFQRIGLWSIIKQHRNSPKSHLSPDTAILISNLGEIISKKSLEPCQQLHPIQGNIEDLLEPGNNNIRKPEVMSKYNKRSRELKLNNE